MPHHRDTIAASGPGVVATDAPPAASITRSGRIGFVLSHEQFSVLQLVELAVTAEDAGFDAVWASDHFQPWRANEGHSGLAWLTLAAPPSRRWVSCIPAACSSVWAPARP